MAYDVIMVFHGRFKNHILPEHIHVLNVSFIVPEMRRSFGGCAGNIAYNLKLLGGNPQIMATVGHDSGIYLDHLDALKIDKTYIRVLPNEFTAQCFITTDQDNNQITAFHPGAMSFSSETHPKEAQNIALGIIGPDSREGMLQHGCEMAEANIPFIFDPGQNVGLFSAEELQTFMEQATYACFNDYEARLLTEKTGKNLNELAKKVKALIVTLGAEGSHVYADGKHLLIPPVKAEAENDPTGCGDAYRAGLLFGISNDFSIEKSARLASLMGAIKIAHHGCQNHQPSFAEIEKRYLAAFKEAL